MSRRAKLIPVVVACGVAGAASAQESDAPDLSFLEYLGSWEDGDAEWLVVAEMADFERDEPAASAGTEAGTEKETTTATRPDPDSATTTETETMADTEAVNGNDGETKPTELADEREETHAE